MDDNTASKDQMMNHLPHLQTVADQDVAELQRKEETYQGSWRRSGGVNAWHMIRRKIDRLNVMLAPLTDEDKANLRSLSNFIDTNHALAGIEIDVSSLLRRTADAEDIFVATDADTSGADGTVLAEVRDLRRYLLLVEARLVANSASKPESFADMEPRPEFKMKSDDILAAHVYSPDVQAVSKETSVPEYVVDWVINSGQTYSSETTVSDPNSRSTFQLRPVAYDRVVSAWQTFQRRVPRVVEPVPAEDSSRHAERVSCTLCGDTGIIRTNLPIGSRTTVCHACRRHG